MSQTWDEKTGCLTEAGPLLGGWAGKMMRSIVLAAAVAAFLSAVAAAETPEQIFSQVSPSVVIVERLDVAGHLAAFGSGVVIGSDDSGVCRIVTNRHVIAGGVRFRVRRNGQLWDARVIHVDPNHDLAELSVEGFDAPAVQVRDSSTLAVGEKVYAIGTPEGLALTISEGLISGLRDFQGSQVIQTSAAISPGSSGGGLFDDQGRLVGITSFQLKQGQNLNFAWPADLIPQLNRYGESAEGELTGTYFGLVNNLTVGKSADFSVVLSENGAVITGCMAIFRPLVGSGPLIGAVRQDQVEFEVKNTFFSLVFRGRIYPDRLVGLYVARPVVGPLQKGTFALERTSATGLPDGFSLKHCRRLASARAN
jgi:S1-C subfamily serine protease